MRPRQATKRRRVPVAAGAALILAIPTAAVALAAGQAHAQSAIQFRVNHRHLGYGRAVEVTGNATSSDAGQTLQLEFAPAGSTTWRAVSSTTVRSDGSFSLASRLPNSGLLRVQDGSAPPSSLPSNDAATSIPQQVTVSADLLVRARSINVLGGQRVSVAGRLLPGVSGRRVVLQSAGNGGWKTLASAHTGHSGHFDVRYRAGGLGEQQLRLKFAGDALNARSTARAGKLTVYRQSVASWYDDAGDTACGFHAYYGVANKTLPCGTKVSFRYNGKTVTAVVDDRGPFVPGRDWDLNQNTAGALGFGGVDTLWSSA